jgi:hypothetical protein
MGSSLANAGGPSVGNQAAGSSIAGAGLQAYGEILKSQGVAAGDTFKADVLEQNGARGDVAAVQTGGDFTRKLNIDLGNIDAMRAAVHTDPTSPTGAAIRDSEGGIEPVGRYPLWQDGGARRREGCGPI